MKLNVNSVDIAYDDHGIGLPVLFLHAFPLNRSMWTGQITALLNEGRFRLVALDWRGFGESTISHDISTMELLADDLAKLMDALGMQRAVLCGLSMGGYVAFAFVRKYPWRVAGMILADTRPGVDNEEGKANRESLARLALSEGSNAVADLQVVRLLSDYTRQHYPEVEARVWQLISAATPGGIAAASRGMALRGDATELLAAISCPCLVMVGEEDKVTPPALVQAYAVRIPAVQVAVIPRAGHLSNLEQPEVFFEHMRTFLVSRFAL